MIGQSVPPKTPANTSLRPSVSSKHFFCVLKTNISSSWQVTQENGTEPPQLIWADLCNQRWPGRNQTASFGASTIFTLHAHFTLNQNDQQQSAAWYNCYRMGSDINDGTRSRAWLTDGASFTLCNEPSRSGRNQNSSFGDSPIDLYQAKCNVPMAIHSHPHISSHCPFWNVECLVVCLTDNLSEPNISVLLDMSFRETCIFLNTRNILKRHNCLGDLILPKKLWNLKLKLC